jgi:dCTP deaminase
VALGRDFRYPIVDPYPADRQFQPASIDLLLGGNVAWMTGPHGDDDAIVDPYNPELLKRTLPRYHQIHTYEYEYYLMPKEFILAETRETIFVPNGYVGRIEGKSSLARLGLFAHVTAGFVDPGFHGKITLELFNASLFTICLRKDMPICQLALETTDGDSERPYGSEGLGSRYQDAGGLEGSRAGEERS